MNLNEFIEYVESEAAEYSLKVNVLARTENAVKIRLEISPTIFVQFYHHQKSDTPNYVLVGWNRPLYEWDSVAGKWHRHPYQNHREHDMSREGGAVAPREFLEEVFGILQGEELL